MAHLKRWPRRLLYLFILVVWIILISFPFSAFVLATQGEIEVGSDSTFVRLFLVQEADAQGVGINWTRSASDRASCSKSSIYYLFWEGHGENTRFCQCFDPLTGQALTGAAPACPNL